MIDMSTAQQNPCMKVGNFLRENVSPSLQHVLLQTETWSNGKPYELRELCLIEMRKRAILIPEELKDEVSRALRNVCDKFNCVLTSSWWSELRPIAQSIEDAFNGAKGTEFSAIVRILQGQRENGKLRVPDGAEHWAFVLALFPGRLRCALQPLVCYHETKKQLEFLERQMANRAEPSLVKLLDKAASTTIFTGAQFQALCKEYPLDEVTTQIIAKEQLASAQLKANYAEYWNSDVDGELPNNSKKCAWYEVLTHVVSRVLAIRMALQEQFPRFQHTTKVPDELFTTDTGHFNTYYYDFGFLRGDILLMTSGRMLQWGSKFDKEQGPSIAEARGGVIVVEDDPAQMDCYRGIVGCGNTACVECAASRFVKTPAEFLKEYSPANLADIALIVLDIESEGDPDGGVELACTLMDDAAKLLKDFPEKRLRMVVWSSNPARVEHALSVLDSKIGQLNDQLPISTEITINDQNDNPGLKLSVVSKGTSALF